jgi:hypothetical protein
MFVDLRFFSSGKEALFLLINAHPILSFYE